MGRRTSSHEWDAYARQWLADQPQQGWRRHSDAVNTAILARWLPPGKSNLIVKTDLFDEAVTEGLAPILTERAKTVVGLDLSQRILDAAARKHSALACICADVRSLPIDSASVDVVVSLSTLDHFDCAEHVERALAELQRVLRPGGTMVLTVDNLANPIIAIRNSLPFGFIRAIGLVPYPVGRTYGPARLQRLVRTAGFDIEQCDAIMHAPRVAAIPSLALLRAAGLWSERMLVALSAFEHLSRLPTRYITGHFIAVKAIKPHAAA